MSHFGYSSARVQMIVDPAGEHRRLHPSNPGLRQLFHPAVESLVRRCNGALLHNGSIRLAYATANTLLVYVQAHVMHTVHRFSFGWILKLAPGLAFSSCHHGEPYYTLIHSNPDKLAHPAVNSPVCRHAPSASSPVDACRRNAFDYF